MTKKDDNKTKKLVIFHWRLGIKKKLEYIFWHCKLLQREKNKNKTGAYETMKRLKDSLDVLLRH